MTMLLTGHSLCLPSQATVQELFSVARDAGIVPDISLDPVLTTFLSLDSSAALEHQYTSIQRSMTEEQLAAFHNNLTSELGGSSRVSYGGVGVVALALSILFDLIRAQGSLVGESSTHRLQNQRIFGISSSSRIGWIIHSYLSEIPGIANNQEKMAEITELHDNWLKLELIDHFERMTNKKRMGSESMQQWLVGAAVHLHMRIHQVRLHSVPTGSAESLRLSYKTGFSRLVQGYTAYLRRNIQETAPPGTRGPSGQRQTSANRSNLSNMTSLSSNGHNKTNMTSFTRRFEVPPVTGRLNQTSITNLPNKASGSSEVIGLNGPKGSDKTAAATVSSNTSTASELNMSTGGSMTEELASHGLLVIEPLRNVSHRVQHHPCESSAIEQGLVTRIIDAQDLEDIREFFLYSEKLFRFLLRQSDGFELKTK
ncbi:uncharacterized protein ACJ7VT_001462 isoform 2-T2 [Polymixia lowei]